MERPPSISVFTPTYGDSTYLGEAWDSLKAQTFGDWEWVILVNNSTVPGIPVGPDPRVRTVLAREGHVHGVGHAKRIAAAHCRGEILVELDHDDLLEPTCLAEVHAAFARHPEASLVFSRFTQIQADGSPDPIRFSSAHGWVYDEQDGYLVPRNPVPTPHNVSLIWYAPNHVRAFRRSAYTATTGYDRNLKVLDDLALMGQLYRQGPFVPIDVLLYRQRFHGANTQLDLDTNAAIQSGTWEMYEQNITPNYLSWCDRNSLHTAFSMKEFNSLLDLVDDEPNTFGLIRLYGDDAAMHLDTELMLMAHWQLAPNGMLSIFMPEGVPINEHWFRAWCGTDHARFQESRIRTVDVDGERWVQANLIAVKEGYAREGGFLYASI